MQTKSFCQQFITSNNFRKSRLLIVSQVEDRLLLRSSLMDSGLICFIRISDCIDSNDFLLSPMVLFKKLRKKIIEVNKNNKIAFVEGLDALVQLWSSEHVQAAYVGARDLLDNVSLRVLIITSNLDENSRGVFRVPRYSEGGVVLPVGSQVDTAESSCKLYLLDKSFTTAPIEGRYLPDLKTFVREYEDQMLQFEGCINIFVKLSELGWAGISPTLEQIYSKKRFLNVFCGLRDELSEAAVNWLYDRIVESKKINNVLSFVQVYFFPSGLNEDAFTTVPQKMRNLGCIEQEVLLWMLHFSLRSTSYLAYVVNNPNATTKNFLTFYVCEALNHLQDSNVEELAEERKRGLEEIGISLVAGELATFIKESKVFPIEQVAPWLNCQTLMEKHELVRRIIEMEAWEVPASVLKSYPLLADYMQPYEFCSIELNEYFSEYRRQKLKNYVTPEFCEKAKNVSVEAFGITSRDCILQTYANDPNTALLVVDALGAEYIPLILALAKKNSLDVETSLVAYSKLPTSTQFNSIAWPKERRLQEIKVLDNIIHNGAEPHTVKPVEENFVALLEVFETKILMEVAKAMTIYSCVILTADHGATRLAACAYQQGLIETLPVSEKSVVDDWRYVTSIPKATPNEDLIENLSGTHWCVKGYNRLPKKGGKPHEMHGGATYEEMLVPVIVFKKGAVFIPQIQQLQNSAVEFVENDDFDL